MKTSAIVRPLLLAAGLAALLTSCKDSPTGPKSDEPSTIGYVTPLSVEYQLVTYAHWKKNQSPDGVIDRSETGDRSTTDFDIIAASATSSADGSIWVHASVSDSTRVTISGRSEDTPTIRFEKVGSSVGGLSGTVAATSNAATSWSGGEAYGGWAWGAGNTNLDIEFRFRVDDADVDLVVENTGEFSRTGWVQFELERMRLDQPDRVDEQLYNEEFHVDNEPVNWQIRCEAGREYVLRIEAGCSATAAGPLPMVEAEEVAHTFQALFKKPND